MRLVHLADLHLGYRAYNRVTRQGVNRREADIFAAFRQALEQTIALNPDLVLIAGDVFHVPRPGNLAVVQTQRELFKFRQRCPAEVVVIAGNHESVRSRDNSCILELMALVPGVSVVCDLPEAVVVAHGQIKVFALPHNALEQTAALSLRPDPEVPYNVLMLHGTVDHHRINDYGGYTIPADLLDLPWDYVACGHYHSFTHLGAHAFYAGAIERTSNDIWREADEPKGFVWFDLERHRETFMPLEGLRSVVDLPAIDGTHREAHELDRLIHDHVVQIGGVEDKIVRQQILNLPKSVQRQLDYRQIRELQTAAVHYLLDGRSPKSARTMICHGIYQPTPPPRHLLVA
ncbi:MAG: DNA repair exonuclease [Oscillatoriales cyanobacterium SM2_2_1]|nr:DNA repair exonuclease [Oscillatoriales cyanobacterium SM2_2_1]